MSTSDVSRPGIRRSYPKSLGFSMPPEWSPHRATWLSWPHNPDTWPGAFETVEPAYKEIVDALVESEPVLINVLDADHEQRVRGILGRNASRVRFVHIPTNDAWVRDHGATFVRRSVADCGSEIGCVSWVYNAWGGKYPPYDLDRLVAERMAEVMNLPLYASDLCVEGGAIEVNGAGVVMTTESCVLNPNRNPELGRPEVDEALLSYTGTEQVLWLPGGDLAGDDTDGHIDNIARFVSEDTVVIASGRDPADPNYVILVENRRALTLARPKGAELRVIDLPAPDPVYFDGRRLPASYANFYIANSRVLVPTFRCAQDRRATETLQRLFPDRRVVGIDCVDLVWGLGAVHCLTQQVPV